MPNIGHFTPTSFTIAIQYLCPQNIRRHLYVGNSPVFSLAHEHPWWKCAAMDRRRQCCSSTQPPGLPFTCLLREFRQPIPFFCCLSVWQTVSGGKSQESIKCMAFTDQRSYSCQHRGQLLKGGQFSTSASVTSCILAEDPFLMIS